MSAAFQPLVVPPYKTVHTTLSRRGIRQNQRIQKQRDKEDETLESERRQLLEIHENGVRLF
jgi:hypothetical protein